MPANPSLPTLAVLRPVTRRSWSDYRLIALDMDSTLLQIETIDRLAAACQLEVQMAQLTEAAMQGQVANYAADLLQRVALLRGLRSSDLHAVDVLANLTDGAQTLIDTCLQHGLYCMVISSGFTVYAERVQQHLGMQAVRANVLEQDDSIITGALLPQPGQRLVDAEEKKNALLQACRQCGIDPSQAIAVGDGANDVAMVKAAGLGVAFHAKPALRAHADIAIDHGGLDQLLHFLSPS